MMRHEFKGKTCVITGGSSGIGYAVPKQVAKKYAIETKKAVARLGSIPAEDVFAELDKKYTKPGALLKGLRSREGLSQVAFAKKIGVSQANLSKMAQDRLA